MLEFFYFLLLFILIKPTKLYNPVIIFLKIIKCNFWFMFKII